MYVTFEIKHVTSYRQNTGQHTEELVGFPRKTDKEVFYVNTLEIARKSKYSMKSNRRFLK